MELESTLIDFKIIDKYITEKINELSLIEIEEIKNNPFRLREYVIGDIVANNLKQSIVSELDFYKRKAFLIKVETFIFKLCSKRFNDRLAPITGYPLQ